MHDQDRKTRGGRCGFLPVPRFSTWQTWRRGSRHQEATSTSDNGIRLKNIWKSGRFSQKAKLRILNSNVLSVLLYGTEMLRVTATDLNKLDVFHCTCLRRVLRIFWPNHLSNEELRQATGSTPVLVLIRGKRWRWLGHVLRKSPNKISRNALTWAPESNRRRGRPGETW